MQNDDPSQQGLDHGGHGGRWYAQRGRGFQAATVLLIVASLSATGFLMMSCVLRPPETSPGGDTNPTNAKSAKLPPFLFHDWPKDPELVLVLTGERHGYVQPCGCSSPQVGGVERLYNLVQLLKAERGWTVLPLDLGDTPQREGPAGLPNVQGVLKYYYTMRAMEKVGFRATSFGEYEAAQPLPFLLDHLFQDPALALPSVLACNLHDRQKQFMPDKIEQIASWKIAEAKGSKIKVGVIGAIGVDVGDAIHKTDRSLSFDDLRTTLPATIKEMDAKNPDLRVLLYHGKPAQAKSLAERMTSFDVILSMSDEDEAPSKADQLGKTMIVPGLGHKGKNIGVVGIWRTGKPDKPFELRYQQVRLGEEFLTPKDQEKDHPITKLMEQYTKELKDGDYLHKYPHTGLHELQRKFPEAKYVGSSACQSCHKEAFKIWMGSNHAHAYKTLVERAKRPSLRQYDGECVVCHTIGFKDQAGFVDETTTPKLINVGCESCHGPGSPHLEDNYDKEILALMNPDKAKPDETEIQKKRRTLRLQDFCRKCHDQENDVNWDFDKRWPDIVHMETKK
ncbi:MAG TPA: multiheme c-type cytochrome [Gemmataceae bacterium]